jgi:hypothetical protein
MADTLLGSISQPNKICSFARLCECGPADVGVVQLVHVSLAVAIIVKDDVFKVLKHQLLKASFPR